MDAKTLNEILQFIEADFRAIEKLPASGQRVVFTADQISTSRKFILKLNRIIPVHVARIQREIRVLESLDSVYFPKFYYQTFVTDNILEDFYDNFDPRNQEQKQRVEAFRAMCIKPFLITVEEFIEHVPWENKVEELKNERQMVAFFKHIFTALTLLWDKKIVHRDLKPDNILLKEDLLPVVIDLGIAKSFRPGTQEFTIFQTPCTPRYAAPEQLTNSKTEITYKTDQFSVGVIAFYILTGRFPYGDVYQIQEQILENFSQGHMENIHDYNDSVSDSLVNFINKLLQVHPYKRFRQQGDAILQRLDEIGESLT